MLKVKVYSPSGEVANQILVSENIEKAEASDSLIMQVIQTHLGNLRQSNAHTKDRSEVSGGGKKPWKQKGTGNARAGSNRSPLWVGGGITFGPRNIRNFKNRLPKKMATKVVKTVLAEKIRANRFIVVEKFTITKIGTKQMQSFLEKLPIEGGRILLVLAKTNPAIEMSASNLAYIKTVQVAGMNLLDLLKFDYLLTDKEGLDLIEKRFIKKVEKEK